jgi:L-2-hydroxyglutarate oxidase LhgO
MPFKPSFWEQQTLLSTYDCVIVGAGLTGLHTALLVRKKYPKFKIAI